MHGGGFYTAKKFTLAPEKLPPELHWFKWEAYTTLISGFFLMCLVYYWGAEVALIDPSVMPLDKWEAIAIGLAFLVAGWLFYDWLCRSAFGEDDARAGRPAVRSTASSPPGRSATSSPAAAPTSISAPCWASSWCSTSTS